MILPHDATMARVWEYRSAGEPDQTPEWRELARWLARTLGTAHSARYLAEASEGVELFSVSAGEGAPHGARRLVWHVRESGRLWCECCRGVGCAHVGAVALHCELHDDERRIVYQGEPTAEGLAANVATWLCASGWIADPQERSAAQSAEEAWPCSGCGEPLIGGDMCERCLQGFLLAVAGQLVRAEEGGDR